MHSVPKIFNDFVLLVVWLSILCASLPIIDIDALTINSVGEELKLFALEEAIENVWFYDTVELLFNDTELVSKKLMDVVVFAFFNILF
jgi:hypothetical protein